MIFTLIIYDVSCNWSVSGTGLSKVLKKNGSCSTESAAYQEKSFWRNGEDWDGPGAEACENLEKDYIMKWEAGAIVPLNASGLLFTLGKFFCLEWSQISRTDSFLKKLPRLLDHLFLKLLEYSKLFKSRSLKHSLTVQLSIWLLVSLFKKLLRPR